MISGRKKTLKVAIVNIDNALTSAIAGIGDIFAIANSFSSENFLFCIETSIVSLGSDIQVYNPYFAISTIEADDNSAFDLIIIPPVVGTRHYANHNVYLLKWLNLMHNKGSIVCSVCAGAYILAQTGLLDHKSVTTHWSVESDFIKRFPNVKLNISKILIDESNIITAGGGTAYIDLSLYIIKKFISMEVAYSCAKYLLIDTGRVSQEYYKDLSVAVTSNDEEINRLLAWIKQNIDRPLNIKMMSDYLSVSEKTLTRKFKKATGELPKTFVQKIKIEHAKDLLINTTSSFEHITYLSGYNDTSSFRRLFKKMTSLSPGEYRKKFAF